MGQVISFAGAARRRALADATPKVSGEAEILFFLGVRYFRDEQEGGDANPGAPKSGAPTRGPRGKRA